MPKQIIVTSALPYANGPLHLGHVVGAYLPADVYVRFRRMLGDDVHFVCGTDEHGVAITLRAEAEGRDYPDYVDHWHAVIRRQLERFDVRFDVFSGTAHHRNPYHRELAQAFFTDCLANGYLFERVEEHFYSETLGRFLPDRYVEGTCYLCGYEKARGDECPSCGKYLDAKLLKDPRATIDGSAPVLRPSRHWYLDLARARDEWLRDWLESKRDDWKPNVRNFALGDIDKLHARSMTRDLPWGVPVPLPGTEGKVLYVWFDAPVGYLSISKQYWTERGRPERFEQLWKDPATELYHFLGKDNITFHAVVFPAILRATGRGWILPDNVPANEFFNLEGRKFNTSAGWYVPESSLEDQPTDALRWALCTMMPETADSEWTWEEYRARVNDDLADNLGNFVTRTLRFIENEKFFGGVVPAAGVLGDAEQRLLAEARNRRDAFAESLGRFQFRQACRELMALSSACNGYYEAQQPWAVWKREGRERAGTILRVCTEMVRDLAMLCAPMMPSVSATLREALGVAGPPTLSGIGEMSLPPGALEGLPLTRRFPRFSGTDRKTGTTVEKIALVPRVPDEKVERELARLRAAAESAPAPEPAAAPHEALAPEITFDAFAAVDLRAATIVTARQHPNADRLLVLEVDLGFERRTVCAGVAQAYSPEELIGRRVVVVANLASRRLRGIDSHGMLLATDDAAGKPRFLAPDPGTADGTRVR